MHQDRDPPSLRSDHRCLQEFSSTNRPAAVPADRQNDRHHIGRHTGAYVELEAGLRDANPDLPIFVGNVEGFPEPKRILSGLLNANVKRVTLLPLMVVAGDHAANDMVGDEPDSWKNMFKNAGIEVIPVLRGLGELDGWANIYVQHLKDAITDKGF